MRALAKPPSRPRTAGFTLIEVLVALAIFAVLATGAVTLLSSTLDSQSATEDRMARLAAFERARALLSADLGQAADRPTRGLDGLSWPGFSARNSTEDGIVFQLVRRGWENPAELSRASMVYVEYALVEGRLERRTRAMLDGAPLGPPAIVLEGVSALSVDIAFSTTFTPVNGVYRGAPPAAVALTMTLDRYGPVRQAFLVAGAR